MVAAEEWSFSESLGYCWLVRRSRPYSRYFGRFYLGRLGNLPLADGEPLKMLKIEIFDEKTGVPDTDNSNRMLNNMITYAFNIGYEDSAQPNLPRKAKRAHKHASALTFANAFINDMLANARRIIEMADSKEN